MYGTHQLALAEACLRFNCFLPYYVPFVIAVFLIFDFTIEKSRRQTVFNRNSSVMNSIK